MPSTPIVDHPADRVDFRERLRDAIRTPSRKMLLDAAVVWREHAPLSDLEEAVFETSSGQWHREFITLWELFDERPLFGECIAQLAAVARRVRAEKGYTTIVTSTATAKHLVDHVHAKVESNEERIGIRHLGPYPFLASGNREVIDFRGEKVLIVTDVVDSGKVLGNLAKVIRDLNGDPVAALSVVVVGREYIDSLDDEGEFLIPTGTKPDENLRVHTLTDCLLSRLEPPDDDKYPPPALRPRAVIKLDPGTLLPILPPEKNSAIRPAIGAATMYGQFEEAGAIAFDFFRAEAGLLTTAIRLGKLFGHSGEDIWAAVRGKFDGDPGFEPLLVTTFDWGDLAFKEFVEDRLASAGRGLRAIFAGRRGDGSYFILDHYHEDLDGKSVTLILSSVQSGQKVRDLATLLASFGVREINVVCLMNRMGRRTAEFLTLTRQLMRGLSDGPTEQVPFNFCPVYSLSEIASDDLRAALDTVRTLFDFYLQETRVPSFRRWVNQVWDYFEPKPLTGHAFTAGNPVLLNDACRLDYSNGEPVELTLRTEDGKLSVLCGHVATDRNYDPILDEIATSYRQVAAGLDVGVRKHVLFKLFAVMLADVGYLRMTCRFSRLRGILQDQIQECQAERFRIEKDRRRAGGAATAEEGRRIDSFVELESHLLFGWAMFSYLDHSFEDGYDRLVLSSITGGVGRCDDWEEYPENFVRYFGEERVFWTMSLLLLLSNPRFRRPGVSGGLASEVVRHAKGLIARVQAEIDPKDAENRAKSVTVRLIQLLKIKSNLDMILTELGVHELRLPVDVIRYLHSLLFKARRHHSPIVTGVESAIQALRLASDPGPPGEGDPELYQSSQIKEASQVASIDDGIYTSGQLQTVAEAVGRLFGFHNAPREKADHFTDPPPKKGFAANVSRFGDLLQAIRKDKRVSSGELEDLATLGRAILDDLWDDHTSYLRETLRRYIVPLEPALLKAMKTARDYFQPRPYADIFKAEMDRIDAVPKDKQHLVLIEPLFFHEVLKNLFLNVRHSLAGFEKEKKEAKKKRLAGLVRLTISASDPIQPADPTADPSAVVTVRLVSKGRKYDPKKISTKGNRTLDQHAHGLVRYGGSLAIGAYRPRDKHDRDGTEVILTLVGRGDYRQFVTAPAGAPPP